MLGNDKTSFNVNKVAAIFPAGNNGLLFLGGGARDEFHLDIFVSQSGVGSYDLNRGGPGGFVSGQGKHSF